MAVPPPLKFNVNCGACGNVCLEGAWPNRKTQHQTTIQLDSIDPSTKRHHLQLIHIPASKTHSSFSIRPFYSTNTHTSTVLPHDTVNPLLQQQQCRSSLNRKCPSPQPQPNSACASSTPSSSNPSPPQLSFTQAA
ncbi:hypothetical protein G7K_5685-t1 [Saitoella complicata NRRL Y-17804]|uniref:Uncharacterized protein n=1 Tax=Saitoella complicata (strain BCRC 22490 / CBS 7301 / JCM 7358 / NBRC 10748 / NRRL Y-17804) TaxID=698492 RepID=A0A0E9NPI7_SAICN|nr:hypothetical protein G7K_5685-t1 [Saitoella complicata NRRL Y-17804]